MAAGPPPAVPALRRILPKAGVAARAATPCAWLFPPCGEFCHRPGTAARVATMGWLFPLCGEFCHGPGTAAEPPPLAPGCSRSAENFATGRERRPGRHRPFPLYGEFSHRPGTPAGLPPAVPALRRIFPQAGNAGPSRHLFPPRGECRERPQNEDSARCQKNRRRASAPQESFDGGFPNSSSREPRAGAGDGGRARGPGPTVRGTRGCAR